MQLVFIYSESDCGVLPCLYAFFSCFSLVSVVLLKPRLVIEFLLLSVINKHTVFPSIVSLRKNVK